MKKVFLYLTALLLTGIISCKKDINNKDLQNAEDGFITLQSGVVVEKKGHNYTWLGDIVLTESQLTDLDKYGTIFRKAPEHIGPETSVHPVYNFAVDKGNNNTVIPRAFGVYPTSYNLWAMVRFRYANDLTSDRKSIAQQAMLHWQANSNVRFYNATNQPTVDPTYGFPYPYIEFTNSTVNNSYVGRQPTGSGPTGGRQIVNLAAFQPTYVAIHEIGHAIGLFHEQSRNDRDTYLNINLNNVASGNQSNFQKVTSNYYAIGGIDFSSVMMYDSYAFAVNSSVPVMTKKSDGSTFTQGTAASVQDRKWGNTFYIPYIARSDTYAELDNTVYKADNTVMTAQERLQYQAQLNNGNATPPNCCRLPNTF